MGASKSDFFTTEQNGLAVLLKAMAHPARIAILEFLISSDKCMCGDIVDELPLAQPTVSQHLKELKSAGLIKGNIEGNSICYCIDKDVFNSMMKKVQSLLKPSKGKLKCC